jgi:hypothetical protein
MNSRKVNSEKKMKDVKPDKILNDKWVLRLYVAGTCS